MSASSTLSPSSAKPVPFWRDVRWQWACFLGALVFYAFTRFAALEQFPIYFFCDEAIHTVCADELAANHFRTREGELLPTYFRNFAKYNLSLSVYVQGVSRWVAGQSIWTVRATSALLSLTSAAALAWMLHGIFRIREWWLGAMLLAVTPVWLVHSRTGFETSLMVSCYGWFLLFYLLYRYRNPRWIFAAMLAGAAVFYAYANGQGVMALSAVLLLLSDASYHWKQKRWAAGGLGFALVLFLPYLRFRHNHPDFLNEHLRDLGSFVSQAMPWQQKALIYLGNYAHGLDPHYWFFPGQEELVRHTAPGYGHFFTWLLPFFLIGMGVCLWRWKESRYRVLLIAMLAAPFSAALAGVSAYRALEFILPANAMIALGISCLLDRVRSWQMVLAARGAVFAGFALTGSILLTDCLAFGPTVSEDYGMYGMQWGSRELIRDMLPHCLRAYPKAHIYVSPNWANGVDVFAPFFQLPARRVSTVGFGDIRSGAWNATEDDLLVVTPDELEMLRTCDLYDGFAPLGRVSRPDGRPGFYMVRPHRSPAWAEKLAALHRQQSAPIASELQINGQPVTVRHPPLELGTIEQLFDSDLQTAPRCYRGIPMVIELSFPKMRSLESITIYHRDRSTFHQRVEAFSGGAIVCAQEDRGTPETVNPVIRVPLGNHALDRVRVTVEQGPESWVHLRDIALTDAAAAQASSSSFVSVKSSQ